MTDPPGCHLTAGRYDYEREAMTEPTGPVPAKSTPEPVLRAAAIYGTGAALLVTAVGVLVAVGVLSDAEATAITTAVSTLGDQIVPIGVAVVGVVGIVSGVVSNLVTAFAARRHTVPTNSDAYVVTRRDGSAL